MQTTRENLQPVLTYLDALDRPADLRELRRLLRELHERGVSRHDFGAACCFEKERYARNVICKSPWYEAVCVCWKQGQSTPIHDHKGSSCAFLVVEGPITEACFELGDDGALGPGCSAFDRPAGFICASTEADIHEVRNDSGRDAITLHIYSPALANMNIYDRETRRATTWTPHCCNKSDASTAGM